MVTPISQNRITVSTRQSSGNSLVTVDCVKDFVVFFTESPTHHPVWRCLLQRPGDAAPPDIELVRRGDGRL